MQLKTKCAAKKITLTSTRWISSLPRFRTTTWQVIRKCVSRTLTKRVRRKSSCLLLNANWQTLSMRRHKRNLHWKSSLMISYARRETCWNSSIHKSSFQWSKSVLEYCSSLRKNCWLRANCSNQSYRSRMRRSDSWICARQGTIRRGHGCKWRTRRSRECKKSWKTVKRCRWWWKTRSTCLVLITRQDKKIKSSSLLFFPWFTKS